MDFTPKHFDPLEAGGTKIDEKGTVSYRFGDKPEDVYVYKPKTILALNVALATQRPLLISGDPGSGKSTLAENAAAVLGWWYYKQMITSRIQAADLLWTYDTLRRLSDANDPDQELMEKQFYVDPGTLWWAFNPQTARQRGSKALADASEEHFVDDPGTPPVRENGINKAVVLLDEIDKADPDVPNDLLEPFDLRKFRIRETSDPITAERDAMLILTTNGERELPPAFLRRCVALKLDEPTVDWFEEIAKQKFPADDQNLHEEVANEIMRYREAADRVGLRQPSTSEYIDALQVCRDLGINTESKAWKDVARSVLWKHESEPELEKTNDEAS
jgi:MoxR-like ATPase